MKIRWWLSQWCGQTLSWRSNTSHIFIMRWNRWSWYPHFLTVPLQQSEFTVSRQAKSSQHNSINNFFCCKAHPSILLPTSSPKCPEWYWGTSSLKPNGYQGTFLINIAADVLRSLYRAFTKLRPFGLLCSYPQRVPAFISRGATHHTDARDLYQWILLADP